MPSSKEKRLEQQRQRRASKGVDKKPEAPVNEAPKLKPLFWYINGIREELDEVPKGCYVLSDGQVHDPSGALVMPSGDFIRRIYMCNRADKYRNKGTSPEIKLKLKELMK